GTRPCRPRMECLDCGGGGPPERQIRDGCRGADGFDGRLLPALPPPLCPVAARLFPRPATVCGRVCPAHRLWARVFADWHLARFTCFWPVAHPRTRDMAQIRVEYRLGGVVG